MMAARFMDTGVRTRVDYDPFVDGALQRVVPTTEPQREVWLAAKLEHEASLAYNESVSLRLRGALDVERLQQAMRRVVERHDALRASIGPDGETFCVLEPQPFTPMFEDLSALSQQAREDAVQKYKQRGVDTAFALERGRLFRAELLRLQADEHLLLMHAHHIVCDGWSWWVIVRELGALYRDGSAALAPASSFSGYALDSAAHPQGATSADDERYWLSRYAGDLPVLELPLDRPRPMRRTTASAREDRMLDAALATGLKKLGASRGASLFATLLSGFATLMSRISGQERVVVGIPAAGQSVDGHDHLVGHCVNLLPLRFDLDHAASFADSLGAAQETLLDALDHQRYTFGTLLKQLHVARDPSRTPLISVLFNIDQALDPAKTGFEDLELDFTTNPRSHDNFELSINAVQVEGRIRLECQYNRDLFDAVTVRRWLAAYESLLRAAVDRPDEPMARLPLVDAPAMAELAALQPTPIAFDRDRLMHEHFERQCDRTPERIAARYGDASLSYRQLDARANRIARVLRRHGVGRGALVGLALNRGLDMLAALLGILKSGAGYVPLDPAFPQGRLAYMAEDAGLAALVTQSEHTHRFDLRGAPVLALDVLEPALAAETEDRLDRDAQTGTAESVAYVIYTSGSTGKPKGVLLPHRSVANLIASMQRSPGMDPDDRLLAVTTLSFDISVVEMILPLSVGAQVVIAEKSVAGDGQALAALLHESRATVMQATPATWRVLLEAGWKGSSSLKIFCGGEPMQPDLATALLARCGQLWNLYGPTETTVYSTGMRVMPATDGQRWPVIHIGRPLDNTQVWIMDAQGQLCPYGASGEICIGGEGVALGYLDRPELTAERFLPDVLAATMPGFGTGVAAATLYRTGDRGRWRQDGNVEHEGRLDFQVKVRGYRIELGEIENTLAAHPAVTRAVAMAREDRPGDVRLVAYVVPHAGMDVQDAELAAHLRQTLPDYMLPQHFVRLAEMPLLPNGKVNRSALPVPGATVARSEDFLPPRTEMERKVAAIMAGVLGLPEIGLRDNFFVSGGHSLLAAQLTSRLNRELSLGLSLRALFDAPTVEKLAATIESATPDTLPPRPPILHRADQREAPLSLIQERLKLMEEFNPGQLTYNTPSAHWLTGALDLPKFEQAFQAVMQRQTVLRTFIEERGSDSVQVVQDYLDSGLLDVEDLTSLPMAERERFLTQRLKTMIETPFELVGTPLFRARLFKFDDDRHALMFMTHHIIWDGWSFDLLYRDLAENYAALLEGRAPTLPVLPVTYGDFSVWHHDWVASEGYARQREFWRNKLGEPYEAGEGGALDLARGRSKRGTASGRGLAQGFRIDKALGDRLRKVGQGMDATLFVVLLAAYFVLLNRVTGRKDMVIATPVRGRNSADVEELMGYFTNLLPLRVKIDASLPFADAVKRVKDVVLDSFANPDIRLEEVAQELSSRGGERMSALYQTLFSMQDIRQRVTRWGNLDHERLEVFQPGATEDLGLWILERDDGIIASMVYNADVLLEADVTVLRGHYVALLERIASAPHDHVDALGDFRLPPVLPQDDVADAPVAVQAGSGRQTKARVPGQDPRITYLAGVWAEMLDTDVAPNDNFFDLGGHSMIAVQMASRVAKDTGAKLKMMPLASQTLAQLAMELPASMFASEQDDTSSSPTGDSAATADPGQAFFFGPGERRLFGMRHQRGAPLDAGSPTLLCVAPLLQEGIMSQRALWALCEGVANQQGAALRFDWFGTGDSAGDTRQLSLDGMQRDLQMAAGLVPPAAHAPRTLALRSACLPVLLAASASAVPVDLVLWDPVVRGGPLVERWHRQHREQSRDVGRYIRRQPATADDELLGFDVAPGLLSALSGLDFRTQPLPAGSHVYVVVWEVDADVQAFVDTQQAAGVVVQITRLAADDRPPWDDPMQFENQALPRRSVVQLAKLLMEART